MRGSREKIPNIDREGFEGGHEPIEKEDGADEEAKREERIERTKREFGKANIKDLESELSEQVLSAQFKDSSKPRAEIMEELWKKNGFDYNTFKEIYDRKERKRKKGRWWEKQ